MRHTKTQTTTHRLIGLIVRLATKLSTLDGFMRIYCVKKYILVGMWRGHSAHKGILSLQTKFWEKILILAHYKYFGQFRYIDVLRAKILLRPRWWVNVRIKKFRLKIWKNVLLGQIKFVWEKPNWFRSLASFVLFLIKKYYWLWEMRI